MSVKRLKYTVVAALAVFCLSLCCISSLSAQPASSQDSVTQSSAAPEAKKIFHFNANKVILEEVKDAHLWHFFTIFGHPVELPLPVILYVPKEGFSIFISSRFHHGETPYDGFQLMTEEYIVHYNLSE
ncbi:MAG: hypothetical protein ACRDE2_09055, partial [Chitinophagaceae bacterium]